MKRGHEDSKKTRHGHVWGQISLKVDFRFFVKLGLYFFLYHVDQSSIAFLFRVKSILVFSGFFARM